MKELPFELYTEHFPLVLNDLAGIDEPVVAEGCALLPRCLAEEGIAPDRVLFMVPDGPFHRARFAERDWARDRVAKTSDPERALSNWINRDVAFAQAVRASATGLGFKVHVTDGGLSCEATFEKVQRHFEMHLTTGCS